MTQDTIHRFRIELRVIRPKIWRRIEVPSTCSFWDLHSAIQDAMGWSDSHLHDFRFSCDDSQILVSPEDESDDDFTYGGVEVHQLLDWETPIADYFVEKGDRVLYTYAFGEDWRHNVTLTAVAPRAADTVYPVCVGGRRACPPEGCGGPWSYPDFLAALADPKHEDREHWSSWVGCGFDPEHFDQVAVQFRNPQERLQAWQDSGKL